MMMRQISIPPSAKEAALETTEEMKHAAKEAFVAGREVLSSFYSQVSCTDLSAIQAPDCAPLKGSLAGLAGGMMGDGEGAVALDWRDDPFLSMSDLTLVVYDGTGGIPYHVHTLLLAYGGRKSGFVAEQIKSQQKKSSKNKKNDRGNGRNDRRNDRSHSNGSIRRQNSRDSGNSAESNAEYRVDIYVPALAARHVPLFLDYVYGSSLELATSTAPPLRYLSNRFDCRDLHREVTTRFIPRDLELSTAPKYCSMADELKDFEMRDRSIRIMAERFERIDAKSLGKLHPRLVRSLVQCERLECGSESLSVKVAQYLRIRDELQKEGEGEDGENGGKEGEGSVAPLTDEDYYWLTHCAHMPKISPKEALFYFNYGTRFPQVMNEIGSGSLKARCLAACSDDWALDKLTSHLENLDHAPMELYDNLDLKMKVQLLESSLVGARKLMEEREKERGDRSERDRDAELSEKIMYEDKGKESVAKAVVLGCGVDPANGIYLYKGDNNPTTVGGAAPGHRDPNEVIAYEKEAVWKGQRVTFVLYPATSGGYYTQYKLAVRRSDDTAASRRILYNSPTVMGTGGDVIPEREWEVEDDDPDADVEGVHPPPRFVGRVSPPVSSWNQSLKRSA